MKIQVNLRRILLSMVAGLMMHAAPVVAMDGGPSREEKPCILAELAFLPVPELIEIGLTRLEEGPEAWAPALKLLNTVVVSRAKEFSKADAKKLIEIFLCYTKPEVANAAVRIEAFKGLAGIFLCVPAASMNYERWGKAALERVLAVAEEWDVPLKLLGSAAQAMALLTPQCFSFDWYIERAPRMLEVSGKWLSLTEDQEDDKKRERRANLKIKFVRATLRCVSNFEPAAARRQASAIKDAASAFKDRWEADEAIRSECLNVIRECLQLM